MHHIIKASIFALLISCLSCKDRPQTFQSVNADTFTEVIAGEGVQILDVRTAQEYADGHIPHSTNIDVTAEGFTTKANETLDKTHTVALYCRSGRRSKKAADLLTQEGYKVVELAGGFNEWKAGNRDIAE